MSQQMSLSQRLDRAQGSSESTVTPLSQLTLEQLATERIQFGQKHLNKTFEEVWQSDPQWVKFVVNRYQDSTKEAHARFMHYVHLQLQEVEQGHHQNPVRPRTQVQHRPQGYMWPQPKPKAKAKPMAQPGYEVPIYDLLEDEELLEVEDQSGTYLPETMETHLIAGQEQTQSRIQNIEIALSQIVQHLGSNVVNGSMPNGDESNQ